RVGTTSGWDQGRWSGHTAQSIAAAAGTFCRNAHGEIADFCTRSRSSVLRYAIGTNYRSGRGPAGLQILIADHGNREEYAVSEEHRRCQRSRQLNQEITVC